MGDDADRLDILSVAETGGDDSAKPALGEAPGIGAYPVDDLDDPLRQVGEAVVPAFDRGRRRRLHAPPAEVA